MRSKLWMSLLLLLAAFALPLQAQLNENCTVSVLNRSVQVGPDGSWVLPNVPTNVGLVRARATCVENGVTRSGQSDYFLVPPNGIVEVAEIVFETLAPIPATIALSAPSPILSSVGATVQVTATATYANGTSGNLSLAAQGTNWFTSNPRIATVSGDGLVTAVSTGNALISAMNEGALGMLQISIITSGDADGDGLPDEFEVANGLNPNDASDAARDLDGDGLTNLQEFERGTMVGVADSDGDGLTDGDEVTRGTNALLADTDNDGVRDGLEVQTGSNPLDASSINLAGALQSITVAPNAFEIVVNTLVGEGSRVVSVTGNLKDGTTMNLTARARGTQYASSNLTIASFGAIDGQIFGGTSGTATITVSNAGHQATATVTVRNFAPRSLSFLPLPGFANNVDVDGNYAYVAAGSAGLVVVNVTNRSNPSIVTVLDTPGNANDVRVVSGIAYVADGAMGLQVIDISNPAAPRIIGTLDTQDAWDVVVYGGTAYVADGAAGLKIIDVRNGAAPALLGTLDTPGTAKGVDVAGNYAVVADGRSTLIIDVTVPNAPTLAGAAGTSSARDVVAEGTFAYVADWDTTLRIIDFSNPAAPQIVGTADRNLAGIPTDVAKVRELVFMSDVLFVNGVSVTDVRSPQNPTVRARLDFPQRDDNGTGIAVDHQFAYLTGERGITENGTSGDTALYIGQYLFAEDTNGIAPTVRLTSPTQQPTAVEGGVLKIAATASDDILVARVEFLINGAVIATDTAEPYNFDYRVPSGIPSIAIQARATDIAGNSAITPQVILSVIPDPGTTVVGIAALENGTAVSGANIACLGRTAVSGAGGNFSIGSIPTITGEIRCSASYNHPDGTPMTGASALVTAIPGGNTNVGTITLRSALGFTKFPPSAWTGAGTNFRAHTANHEGNILALTKWGEDGATGGGSEMMVLLDLADPARPAFLRSVRASVGATYDVELKDGWAYIAGHDFCTFQYTNPNATRNCIGQFHGELAVAHAGGYLFTGTAAGDGRLRLFDVSDPSRPRYLREQSMAGGVNFRDILFYAGRYVIGLSADKPGGVGHDVVVIDIANAPWTRVAVLDIPNFDAWRGEIRGNRLYVGSVGQTEAAIVDLTNPAAPALLGRRAVTGAVYAAVPVGDELFVAARTGGLYSFDVSNPASPVETRAFNFGSGAASDVTVANSFAYVANESELVVVGLAMAPQIDVNRITLERDGSMVKVRGAAGAITGQRPLSMGATNAATSASVSGVAVAADGSFTATLPGAAGEGIDVIATDVAGRVAGPVRVGVVPFGNATFIRIDPALTGNEFRARTLAAEGSTLVVTGFYEDYGASAKGVVFDISNASNPVYKRTVDIVNGHAYDIELRDGWAYVGGHDFCTINIANPSATRNCIGQFHGEVGVAVSGSYAITGTAAGDGRLRIFDISNPGSPRYLYERSFIGGGINFHDVIAYGTDYLVGIAPHMPGGVGHDVVVFNRRDINNIVKIADLDIPNFNGNRGRIYGNKLYVASEGGTKSVVVDLTNPSAPVVVSTLDKGVYSRGVDATGNTVAVADVTAGVTMYDVTNPAAPVMTGRQSVGGSAFDVLFNGGALYVANELGLAVIADVSAPPVVDDSRISIALTTATTANVTGQARAISGTSPLTVEVRNLSTSASVPAVSVNGDGSFVAAIDARPGEILAVTATDGNGRSTGPVVIGSVPFGSSTTTLLIPPSMVGNEFRARTLNSEGNMLVVTGFYEDWGASQKGVVYDITDPANPVHKRTVDIVNGHSYDVELKDGWAYVGGHDFCTINLADPNSTRNCIGQFHGEVGVAASGGYAFTGTAAGDGRLRMFDVSNPAAPRYLYERSFISGGVNYHDVIAFGTDHLIGISPHRPGNIGHDVVVFDRRNINDVVKIADIDIPNFDANRGKLYGSTLYVASNGGTTFAIVDLSNPRAPRVVSVNEVGGVNRGIAAAGTVAVTADGAGGVTFLDVANLAQPSIIGRHAVGGNAWDTLFSGGTLYVANEQGIVIIRDLVAAPNIDLKLITIAASNETTAVVTGRPRAISGRPPLTVELRNNTSGASVPGIAVASDGSFTGSIAAHRGDVLAIVVTDANNRVAGPDVVGSVPFGTAATIYLPPNLVGNEFRARTLNSEGNMLVVTGFYEDWGASQKGVVFDISNPSNPVMQRVVDLVNGHAYDVELKNGWAFVGGHDFCTINLADPNATRNCIGQFHGEVGVAASGGYAFTGTAAGDGRLRIFDVSVPSAPRYLYERSFISGGVNYHDLISYGSDYIIGLSPHRPGNIGHDVVIFDRRNVNDIVKIADLDIPNFDANRGRLYGTTLYVASNGGTSFAIVDVSNPRAPRVISIAGVGGSNRGVSAAGVVAVSADGATGVTFVDVTNPATPSILGRQITGGNTWDTLLFSGTLYVANEQGLVVIRDVVAAPIIDERLLGVTAVDEANARVTGAARSITGHPPVVVSVRNDNTGLTVPNVVVAADGSFSATIAARAGEVVSITATDVNNRSAGPVVVGSVPFGTAHTILLPPSVVGNEFRARTLNSEGDLLVVTGFYEDWGATQRAAIFDISDRANPLFKRVVDIVNGHSYDVDIKGGWAFVGGHDFCTINLADPAATRNCIGQFHGEVGVATSGGYAFTGTAAGDGRLRIFDVANPAAPRYLYERSFISGGVNFHDVIAYGTDYLIGISPHRPGNVGHDVVVFDKRNINDIVKVADIDIPNFDANRGRMQGSMLYVASNGGPSMAVVDLSNPRAPRVLSTPVTGAANRGVAAAGDIAVSADGGSGVTFTSLTNPEVPSFLGRQLVGGNAWDVLLGGGMLYVANEQGIVVIRNVATPPIVDLSDVTVRAASATEGQVNGSTRAITGDAPFNVTARNVTTGVDGTPVAVAADGTFSTTLSARSGDVLSMTATDRVGRVTSLPLGPVPFTSSTAFHHFRPADIGNEYRARTLAREGNMLVVTGFAEEWGASQKAAIFDVSNPTTPVLQRITDIVNGQVYDLELANGWAYVSGHDFCTINLLDPVSTRNCIGQFHGEVGMALSGRYVFTATAAGDGRLRVFDVNTPGAPVYIREQSFISGGVHYNDLVAYGTNYIIGISPHRPGNIGHDVVVFDRTNINNIVKVADFDIPNFNGHRGEIVGNTLYVASDGSDAVALVDLTNPAAPSLISRMTTAGRTRGVTVNGATVYSADSSSGVSVFDVTTPSAPVARGRQPLLGSSWDVLANGNVLYVANEIGLVTLRNTDAPWTMSWFRRAPSAQFASLLSRMH